MAKLTNRLSAAHVRTITARGFHHDGSGLYLQVSPTGSKSWVLRYMLRGQARYMGLGSCNDVSLAEARALAAAHKKVAKEGQHPVEQRRQQRRAIATDEERFKTFEWCARTRHEALAPMWRNSKHAAQWINTLRDYAFPRIGGLPVNEVSLREVKAVLEPIWAKKPETATRLMQRIRSVLVWAASDDRYPGYDAAMWEQLRSALHTTKKKRKAEHLSACPYREAASLLADLHASTISEVLKLAFEFTVLTAARSGEARGALKGEIDWQACKWTVPASRMKMGVLHEVPLSRQAVAVLKAAFAQAPESTLIFPNARLDKPLTDQAFTKVILRETLNSSYTTHGFRSSFRDWAAEQTTFATDVCEAALAHTVKNKAEAAYKRTAFFEKRQPLMQAWADFLGTSNSTILDTPGTATGGTRISTKTDDGGLS